MLRNSKVSISKPKAPSTISSTRSATWSSTGLGLGLGLGLGVGLGLGRGLGFGLGLELGPPSGLGLGPRFSSHLGDVAHGVQVVGALYDGDAALLARDDGDRADRVVQVLLGPVLDERADQRALTHARWADHGHDKRRRDLTRHGWPTWRGLGSGEGQREGERASTSTDRSVRLMWYLRSCFSSVRYAFLACALVPEAAAKAFGLLRRLPAPRDLALPPCCFLALAPFAFFGGIATDGTARAWRRTAPQVRFMVKQLRKAARIYLRRCNCNVSEEAPPKRLRPLVTSPTTCCPIHLRGPRHLAQPASQPTTKPIASPSPYSTGTRGATCSRGRISHTHACSPARAGATAPTEFDRLRIQARTAPLGCGRPGSFLRLRHMGQ